MKITVMTATDIAKKVGVTPQAALSWVARNQGKIPAPDIELVTVNDEVYRFWSVEVGSKVVAAYEESRGLR